MTTLQTVLVFVAVILVECLLPTGFAIPLLLITGPLLFVYLLVVVVRHAWRSGPK